MDKRTKGQRDNETEGQQDKGTNGQRDNRVEKKTIFVFNPDFLGIQPCRKKQINYSNLKSLQNCINQSFGLLFG